LRAESGGRGVAFAKPADELAEAVLLRLLEEMLLESRLVSERRLTMSVFDRHDCIERADLDAPLEPRSEQTRDG